jgi:Fe2+ transport system protein FeoA
MNLKFVFSPLRLESFQPAMLLSEIQTGQAVQVVRITGQSSFRRRLMELGLVPGTRVELVRVAPLGDPVELLVRGASLSIRKAEAGVIEVAHLSASPAEKPLPKTVGLAPDLGV